MDFKEKSLIWIVKRGRMVYLIPRMMKHYLLLFFKLLTNRPLFPRGKAERKDK